MNDPELLALVQQKLVADLRRYRKANPASGWLAGAISARAIDAFAATLLAVIELVLAHLTALVHDAHTHGLYEATADPKRTR